jgi:hypothetical protein
MAEWSIAAVLKTVVPRGTGGSNPSLSADNKCNQLKKNTIAVFFFSFSQHLVNERLPQKFHMILFAEDQIERNL